MESSQRNKKRSHQQLKSLPEDIDTNHIDEISVLSGEGEDNHDVKDIENDIDEGDVIRHYFNSLIHQYEMFLVTNSVSSDFKPLIMAYICDCIRSGEIKLENVLYMQNLMLLGVCDKSISSSSTLSSDDFISDLMLLNLLKSNVCDSIKFSSFYEDKLSSDVSSTDSSSSSSSSR